MEPKTTNQYPMQPQEFSEQEREETTIDLVEILYLFWGNLWKIAVCLVLGMVVAFGGTYLGKFFQSAPQYKATASVYVVPASSDPIDFVKILPGIPNDESLLADVVDAVKKMENPPSDESLIADYKELLLSRPLLQDVVDELSLDVDYTALEKMIEVSDTEDTHVVKIEVTSSEAQMSADIANDLVKQAAVYYEKFVKMDPPELIEEAVAPAQASNQKAPKYLTNAILGGLLGAVLCCGVLLVLFLVNDTFVTPDDILNRYGVQPLAVIPEEKLPGTDSTKR